MNNTEYRLLAQGEYNRNYVFNHPKTGEKMILRVNCGSQMHLNNQIGYEAKALSLLGSSGRTPRLEEVRGPEADFDEPFLVMEYLPGTHLNYNNEAHMRGAAECLADIHSVHIDEKYTVPAQAGNFPADADRLIAPSGSMRAILEECEEMLAVYLKSDIPDESTKSRLRKLLDAAWRLVPEKESSPYRCCINTELNSTNFLVEEKENGDLFVRLVDWEKPLYGDPAQDLAHFLAPTTTFWKTDVILNADEVSAFVDRYINAVAGRFDTGGIKERTKAMIPVTCLRGMCWCAMAWVQYRSDDKDLVNESTRMKLDAYLSDGFISDIEKRVSEAAR